MIPHYQYVWLVMLHNMVWGLLLSHLMLDGTERPIAYGSRALTKAERNHAQIEREAAAIIFGIKKFHSYIFGRKFILITDHKPLSTIFSPKSSLPTLAAARLQIWAIILSAYQYDVEFRPTDKHANADGLSRLPLEVTTDEMLCHKLPLYSIYNKLKDYQ